VIERVLNQSVSGSIPFDPGQDRALAQGEPLAIAAPSSPLAEAVGQLADTLL
jgi:MinD-like ATPase involved in chromosome partitioning or flagellar assembly